MPDGIALWSIRTALLSVRDLDRSSAFYQDVLNVREVSRRYDMAILGTDLVGSPFTLCLRQAERGAILPGQQTIGIRALAYDVGSLSELDRIEARLRALDAFRDRTVLDPAVGIRGAVRSRPGPVGTDVHRAERQGSRRRHRTDGGRRRRTTLVF